MDSQAVEGKALRDAEARERVKRLMERADRAEWKVVRELRLQVYPSAALGMAHLLDFVDSNITSLIIEAPGMLSDEAPWEAIGHRTLDALVLGGPLAFYALTHLRLGRGSVLYPSFLTHLCNIAPRLCTVDIDISWDEWSELGLWHPPEPAVLSHPTNIRRLRICSDYSGLDDGYTSALAHILENSDELWQLSVDYVSSNGDVLFALVDGLGGLRKLEVLHLDIRDAILDHFGGIQEDLALGVLIIPSQYVMDIFDFRYHLPHMRELYFDVSARDTSKSSPLPTSSSTTYPSETQEMLPVFAENLRRNPRLRFVHAFIPTGPADTDYIDNVLDLERSDTIIGHIHSWRYGEEELLYAFLHLNSVEAAHSRYIVSPHPGWVESTKYSDRYGSLHEKRYIPQQDASWQRFSDYRGNVVPLQVIEEMAEAEGMNSEEWGERGVEVGKESWKILEDWREHVEQDGY